MPAAHDRATIADAIGALEFEAESDADVVERLLGFRPIFRDTFCSDGEYCWCEDDDSCEFLSHSLDDARCGDRGALAYVVGRLWTRLDDSRDCDLARYVAWLQRRPPEC